MIEQLETDLRRALSERAADVPAETIARLNQTGYRPRSRAVRPPVAFGALAGIAATAAAAVAIVGIGASAPNAFAGWTAAPTTGSTDAGKAVARCLQRFASMPTPPGHPGIKPVSPAQMKPVLTDSRGPFTFVIFSGQNSSASCISGPSFSAISGASAPSGAGTPAQGIRLSSIHLTTRSGQPYTIVEGHAGDGVKSTLLHLSDGSSVKATTDNGWFAAWWPGSSDATAADLTTPDGVKTQNLSTHGAHCPQTTGPCVSHSSTGSRSGSSFGAISGAATGGSGTASLHTP